MKDYSDIIDHPHHVSRTHPQMSMHDRAAQFSPFAALTGFDAAVAEEARVTDRRIELEEDERQRLNEKLLKLEVTDQAKDLIIDQGFDPIYGARPLKRYLQSAAETLIAKRILSGDLAAGSTLVLDVEDGRLVCRTR